MATLTKSPGLTSISPPVIAKLFRGHVAFGLQSGIDHHKIVIDTHYFGGNHFADAHFLERQALFKERAKLSAGTAWGDVLIIGIRRLSYPLWKREWC